MGPPGILRCFLLLACGYGLVLAGLPGTEFVTVFLQNHPLNPDTPNLQLTITALAPSTVITISINKYSFRKKITLEEYEVTTIKIPSFLQMPPSKLFYFSVIVMSNNPIYVVSSNSKDISSESSSLYPLEELGTEYYIFTPEEGPEGSFKEFAVVASKEPTSVTITPTRTISFLDREYPKGTKLIINLEPFEAVEFLSKEDLSGTRIQSNKPVAVLSGHTCSWKHTKCTHVYEQLQPVSSWATDYLVAPLSFQTKYDLVYVTASKNTVVNYQAGQLKATKELNSGDVLEIKLYASAPLYITSTEGIQVLLYCAGGKNGTLSYDTFLMNVPDITSFCTTYQVVGQEDFFNDAVVLAKTSSLQRITVDKASLGEINWKNIPDTEYSWGEFSLGSKSKALLIEDPDNPFGLITVGMNLLNNYGEPGICVKGSMRPSCSHIKCRKKEVCKIIKGQAVCVSNSESVCWSWGDPHYHTFDGKNYDFQGTCRYTMAKMCSSDITLPDFNIETKNENRGSSLVSYLSSVSIQVYGYNISGFRSEYGVIRVNNQRSQLPVTLHDEKLKIYQVGTSFMLQTEFALKVLYDWNILLKITLPSSFSESVCGLCGNYNGNPNDDLYSIASIPLTPIEFGRSWKVEDNGECWDDCNGPCKKCSITVMQQYSQPSSCGIISLKTKGPFRMCHAVIDPQIYRDNCIYDLCMNDGYKQIMCQALKTYSDACRSQRAEVYEWRDITGCSFECPTNSTYNFCGSACPATCQDPTAPSKCKEPCVETCECDAGFVMIEGRCQPKENCGCFYEGRFLAPNESFWGDSFCKEKCFCNANTHKVECKKMGCRPGEECAVKDGLQDCYATTYGTCTASGDPHYITYDGYHYNFQGTCQYKLSGLCKQSRGLTDFQVHVLNQNRGSLSVSYATAVNVTIYSIEIQVRREYPDQVLIDGLLSNLPLTLSNGHLSIFRSGRHCIIQSRDGIRVTFDWDARVAVTVPSSYYGLVCGLCGNFNNNPLDDFTGQDGSLINDIIEFGQSWKVGVVPGCREVPEKLCPDLASLEKEQKKSKEECGILLDKKGPFRDCHAVISPEDYFEDCIYDLCAYGKRGDIPCRLISAYTSTCQEAGATVYEWRSDTFCNLTCLINSHYDLCSSGCPSTCLSLTTSTSCDALCKEGCACDTGFVLSAGQCVPMYECGCSFNGQYYKAGAVFYPTDTCDQRCSCNIGGSVACSAFSCGPYEECRVEKGVQSCHPVGSALCSAMGESSFMTFDGLTYDFYGNCSYTLAKSCISPSYNLNPFAVKIRNQKAGAIVSSIKKTITVEVYNFTLNILQDSETKILVDGVIYNAPFDLLSGKISVTLQSLGISISTDFGLIINSDLTVRVTVPGNYHNQMCGLCGNYNDNPEDDLNITDGNIPAFANLWKDQDSAELCSSSESCIGEGCPTCAKKKAEALAKEAFCGILTSPHRPFASCHSSVDPSGYLSNCVTSLCSGSGDLCVILQSYVTVCQEAGITITSWRTPSFCPLTCQEHSHFESCADLCSTSCSSLYDTAICPTTCSEGCQCDTGFLFQNGACVPPNQCGCYQNMKFYMPNETVISDGCSQQCTCKANQLLVCEPYGCAASELCTYLSGSVGCINPDPCKSITCRSQESCKIQDGNPVCVPNYVGTCWELGDNHYKTFDGYEFDFHGTCTYVLAKYVGNDNNLVPFHIEEKNENRWSKSKSFVQILTVFVYDYKISISKGEFGKIRINDEITNIPVILLGGKISVSLSGPSAVLSTDFGLQVAYENDSNVVITIPSSYYGETGGLCGNFNQNSGDEMTIENEPVGSITEWAMIWKVKDQDAFCFDICHGNCPKCDETKRTLYESKQYCGLLDKTVDGPFKECYGIISPERFFDNCMYDVCNNNGEKQYLCQALQSYAAMCQKEGVNATSWRIESGCLPQCPENSHYEACGSACPPTCSDRTSPERCTQPCKETCQCNDGYILSGDKCVPVENCGCSYNGRYYQPNQEFWSDDNCKVRCKCDANFGIVMCKESSCGTGEICKVSNGIKGCYPVNYSICVASGDPHYTTFDGRKFDFMGSCVYQFVGVCSNDTSLEKFMVKIQNEHRENKVRSFTKEITLEVYDQIITLRRENPQQVLVNGVPMKFPFSYESNKIKAFVRGEHAFVRTNFDVTMNFNWDNYARVMLPSKYTGAVCGLCGNYNQDPEDDVAPKNIKEDVEFANTWKVGECIYD
ncbi:IgGFc-binding protein-like [Bombina bombina]|uniref:IgGFc-binding protein-like n=1 Tax=Bombina bombina TaxID=8345 RepID=UPI00235A7713|nr:IgGFc-binding protein-like [Bombina bombina]